MLKATTRPRRSCGPLSNSATQSESTSSSKASRRKTSSSSCASAAATSCRASTSASPFPPTRYWSPPSGRALKASANGASCRAPIDLCHENGGDRASGRPRFRSYEWRALKPPCRRCDRPRRPGRARYRPLHSNPRRSRRCRCARRNRRRAGHRGQRVPQRAP